MHVLSVQVGLPRTVSWNGKEIRTSIFKSPVSGPIPTRDQNLAGDVQSDPSVHGGENKALYAYPHEHYRYWQDLLNIELPYGAFGENLTTEGLLEEQVRTGDRFQVGSIELIATQPRLPCYKLGIRHNNDNMVRLFMEALRPGIYFRIAKHGEVEQGDEITLLEQSAHETTIIDLMRLKSKSKVAGE